MSNIEITIEIDNEAGFKKGIQELNKRIFYLNMLIGEAEIVRDNLTKTKTDAFAQYCYPESEISMMKVYVPEHLARSD